MPEYRGNDCPNRGPGLSHVQNTLIWPDGRCSHCFAALTVNPDAIPTETPVELDDKLGRQVPWESEECPARGPGLSHYLPDRVAGPCMHCHQPIVHRLDNEAIFLRRAAQPVYGAQMRLHAQDAMVAYRAQRPLLSAKHSWAARLLLKAQIAENKNPRPDLLAD